ncbi:unnamed protein product [Microthlaspi erraticum]|uniref:RNase H type-1 domain-containing protein n=1 Tax=Microthlaspi erraticum TaxID=1685480 RepID=A0A6D2KHZ2_9BRAS|nr:unnamed protein product [Microthlaspi erraticum]
MTAMENVMSPLHAEFVSLLWAMDTIKQMGCLSIRFETDCFLLTKLIDEEEEWPALATEIEEFKSLRSCFNSFVLSFIPRSSNVRADCLSKGARAHGVSFSHVNSLIPSWSFGAFWSIWDRGAWRDLAHGRSSTGYAKKRRSHLELDRPSFNSIELRSQQSNPKNVASPLTFL